MKATLFIAFALFSGLCLAQQPAEKTNGLVLPEGAVLVRTTVNNGDTIPYASLPAVVCATDRVFKNRRQKQAWDRTKYNVKKVYPYAILAAAKLKEYDRVLAEMPEYQRGNYTKQAEKQLKKEFSDELKKLSMTQGRILIKLIDRETGKTTYDVVKDMRGTFSAFMWQSVAVMFNSSLKSDYDPEGEDKNIELAIRMIEAGEY
jgi:hypothetical protein